jgi:hypothetical protein
LVAWAKQAIVTLMPAWKAGTTALRPKRYMADGLRLAQEGQATGIRTYRSVLQPQTASLQIRLSQPRSV